MNLTNCLYGEEGRVGDMTGGGGGNIVKSSTRDLIESNKNRP